jgi:hypothetical protein
LTAGQNLSLNKKEVAEDVTFFLYLAPIVASIVYGAYEWFVIDRASHDFPRVAYLIVARDPYLFVFSVATICAGLAIEATAASSNEVTSTISANSTRMIGLAVVVLIVSFAGALSAAGYSDIGIASSYFLEGRSAIVYAFFMAGFSILISRRQILGNLNTGLVIEVVGLLVAALSPFALYAGTLIHLSFYKSAIIALVLLAVGASLLATKDRIVTRLKARPKPTSASTESR